jgi:hypothetical protein
MVADPGLDCFSCAAVKSNKVFMPGTLSHVVHPVLDGSEFASAGLNVPSSLACLMSAIVSCPLLCVFAWDCCQHVMFVEYLLGV